MPERLFHGELNIRQIAVEAKGTNDENYRFDPEEEGFTAEMWREASDIIYYSRRDRERAWTTDAYWRIACAVLLFPERRSDLPLMFIDEEAMTKKIDTETIERYKGRRALAIQILFPENTQYRTVPEGIFQDALGRSVHEVDGLIEAYTNCYQLFPDRRDQIPLTPEIIQRLKTIFGIEAGKAMYGQGAIPIMADVRELLAYVNEDIKPDPELWPPMRAFFAKHFIPTKQLEMAPLGYAMKVLAADRLIPSEHGIELVTEKTEEKLSGDSLPDQRKY